MMIFNLPKECRVDKNIPKESIYRNAEADEKFKRIFIDNVDKIRYEYALTYKNSNIERYIKDNERYDEIHFIRMVLKAKGKEKIISGVLKKIGNNRITVEEIYNTGWLNNENEKLKDLDYPNLNSTNMKSFYESIIEKIRIINLSKDSENIEKKNIDMLETLNKEIEELKFLRKKETQINRIVEIQNKLMKKIKERNEILGKYL